MKRKILTLTGVFILIFSVTVFAASEFKMIVNGTQVDVEPKVIDGTTYVPLRAVGEMLGAEVVYDGATKTITINGEGQQTNRETSAIEPVTDPVSATEKFSNVISELDKSTVESTIKENAEKDWKDDYSMQIYAYDSQLEAYNSLVNLEIDSEVKMFLLNDAYDSWENDLTMVLYDYESQMEAYNKIQSLTLESEEEKNILQNALDKWGSDYNMVLYEFETQLEAYEALNE